VITECGIELTERWGVFQQNMATHLK